VTGGWRKLYNEKLHNLYPLPNIFRIVKSRKTRLAGQVAQMGPKRNAYKLLVGKPEGTRALERSKCKWWITCDSQTDTMSW
jgi:hypothetical protein